MIPGSQVQRATRVACGGEAAQAAQRGQAGPGAPDSSVARVEQHGEGQMNLLHLQRRGPQGLWAGRQARGRQAVQPISGSSDCGRCAQARACSRAIPTVYCSASTSSTSPIS